MIIEKDTEILLFRYSNYNGFSFIDEHISVLNDYKYVWMLKLGKRTSMDKLKSILENGGWLILRSPKADGSKSYLTKFTEIAEDIPKDGAYPKYYQSILDGIDENIAYYNTPSFQWFRISIIKEIDEKAIDSLVMSNSGKRGDDVIKTTRTAVMFVKNTIPIQISGVR